MVVSIDGSNNGGTVILLDKHSRAVEHAGLGSAWASSLKEMYRFETVQTLLRAVNYPASCVKYYAAFVILYFVVDLTEFSRDEWLVY